MLIVKILSLGAAERYAVRRLVTSAYEGLQGRSPLQELKLFEVSDTLDIGKLAGVLVLPTLVINGKVVCSGRFPAREEISGWLREAMG